MNTIELEHWVPDPENPGRLKYAGQPSALDVFMELKYRLESMGCLPDEYFMINIDWEKCREIPKGADIFCTTDYGESEGVYVDVYLKWHDDGKPVTKSFITGKTLGENGNDLDRMFLIASAITKAFHGENTTFSRLAKVNGREDRGGSVLHLSMQEQETVINALVEQRERQKNTLNQTEQLLRRMTGSIAAYMDLAGKRPLRMSESDRAVIAIRDGDLDEFKKLLPQISGQEAYDELFLEAAGRPGPVGRRMTMLLLEERVYTEDIYRQACEKAANIAAAEKVALLQEQAREHTDSLAPDFFGKLARYACGWPGLWFLAEQIMGRCSQEEVLAAPGDLMEICAVCGEMGVPKAMARAGVKGDHVLRPIIRRGGRDADWEIKVLLDLGMKISPDNYDALAACVEYKNKDAGQLLIDRGVGFAGFASTFKEQDSVTGSDTYKELAEYWQERQQQEPGLEQSM